MWNTVINVLYYTSIVFFGVTFVINFIKKRKIKKLQEQEQEQVLKN
jgi:preprotein translocase subunit SecG